MVGDGTGVVTGGLVWLAAGESVTGGAKGASSPPPQANKTAEGIAKSAKTSGRIS